MSKEITVPGFEHHNPIPMMVYHTFRAGDDGQLEHYTDGKLRAQVPPEGWTDYANEYPECQPVIDGLRRGSGVGVLATDPAAGADSTPDNG